MRNIGELRKRIIPLLDITREVSDGELYAAIDRVLTEESRSGYFSLSDRLYCRKALYDSFRRLDILSEALEEEGVTEVMVNGYDRIYIEKNGRIEPFGKKFSSPEKLDDVIQQIVARVNRRVNESTPMVDARLADGSRVNVVLPPAAIDGPAVTIRKFNDSPPDMGQLIAWGSLDRATAGFLETLVRAKYNIFISGGTGSGKTTFLGALAGYIGPDERVITVEDSAELRLLHVKNIVRLEARAASTEGKNEITIRDLIRNSLRMRPDRLIVGEIRGPEALDMLTAMNTGHDGSLSTGHANSAPDAVERIANMVLSGGTGLPLAAVYGQIASAIDVIVHLGRIRDGSRKVLSVNEVDGIGPDGRVKLSPLIVFTEEGEKNGRIEGCFRRCGKIRREEKLRAAGLLQDLRENERAADPENGG
ncbi:MAG: CpaF family protein [Lachnospiraceae bacterium]|jgi:pilus assembly protein CpaF